MTLSNLLMTAYVNKASEAGKGVFDILEEVARDYLTSELYEQAAGLFDPDTTLVMSNEYHRGVTELVMRFTGTDSDDKDDVASNISERTSTAYMVTLADFGTGINGDAFYIGPLDVAVAFVKQECEWEVKQTADGKNVLIELDGGNCFGAADTPEMAWRYAIAAELYGNSGDTFEPFQIEAQKR